jgi:hypothetical protein
MFDPAESRPNGIEAVGAILLVSLWASDVLWRLDLSSGAQQAVYVSPASVFKTGDGLRFDATGHMLYVARHNDNSVIAMISCDNWNSSVVATDFFANCKVPTGGSPVVTTLAIANRNLWLFCSDNYGPGPYGFNRISNISGQVNSGANICANSNSAADDDADAGVASSSEGGPFNDPLKGAVVFSFLLLSVGFGLYYYCFYRKKAKDDSSLSTSLL